MVFLDREAGRVQGLMVKDVAVKPWDLQTVTLTSAAAAESVARVIMGTDQAKVSVADLTYLILRSLGFKIAQ